MNCSLSALLSIYVNTEYTNLKHTIDSVSSQTFKPDELVVVIDGEVKPDVNEYLQELSTNLPYTLKIIRLETNQGLGLALKSGVEGCMGEFIVRIDDSDVSHPDRFKTQHKHLISNTSISALGSWANEVDESGKLLRVKKGPQKISNKLRFLKLRNPVSHPTVMFRKNDVISVGNYFEDYDLWLRLLAGGHTIENIENCLVDIQVDSNFYGRRHGFKYVMHQANFINTAYRNNLISSTERLLLIVVRSIPFMTPIFLKKAIYNLLRRI